jgi:hypothetical protein
LAVTVAGASTTSVTVDRPTVPRRMPLSSSLHPDRPMTSVPTHSAVMVCLTPSS